MHPRLVPEGPRNPDPREAVPATPVTPYRSSPPEVLDLPRLHAAATFAAVQPPVIRLSDRFGDYLLHVACLRCKHTRTTEPVALARIAGWNVTLAALAKRLRCSSCGAKECELTTSRRPRPRGLDLR